MPMVNPLDSFRSCGSRGQEGMISDLAVAYLATGNNSYAEFGIKALKALVNKTASKQNLIYFNFRTTSMY